MKTWLRRRSLVPLLSAAFMKSVSGSGMRRFRQYHGKTKTKSGNAGGEYIRSDDNDSRHELWANILLLDKGELMSVPPRPLSISLADLESIPFPLTLPNFSFLDTSTTIDVPFDYSWIEQGGDEDTLSLSMPNMSMAVDEDVDIWGVFETFEPTSESNTDPTSEPTKDPTSEPTSEPTSGSTPEPISEPSSDPTSEQPMQPSSGPTLQPRAELTTEPPKNVSSAPADQGYLNNLVPQELPTTSPNTRPYTNSTALPEPPSNQTPVPTGYLSDTEKAETTLVQFQMRSMSNTMNDYEVLGIFQPSCGDYLTSQLMFEEPAVSNIECQVTNQQLTSLRKLIKSNIRRLDESSTLLVDINVTGDTIPEGNFHDIIQKAFVGNVGLFINSLKNKGEFAGIDTFDQLYSMVSVQQTNDMSELSSGDNPNDGGARTRALVVVLTGVASVALLIGALIYFRLKSSPADFLNDDGEESEVNEPPPEHVVVGSKTKGLGFDFGLGFLRSPDEDLGLISSDDDVPKIRREIIAPPGKLGVITDDSLDGPIVHSVRDDSPLKGLVFPGDLIVALDDEDTSELSSHSLTKLVASRSKFERKITALSEVFHIK